MLSDERDEEWDRDLGACYSASTAEVIRCKVAHSYSAVLIPKAKQGIMEGACSKSSMKRETL